MPEPTIDELFLAYWDKTIHHPLRDMSQDELYDAIMESRKVEQMTEPTIDEMLKWVDRTYSAPPGSVDLDVDMQRAISDILEQHRDSVDIDVHSLNRIPPKRTYAYVPRSELEAVRAFVERVEERFEQETATTYGTMYARYHQRAMRNELAAMEKEND